MADSSRTLGTLALAVAGAVAVPVVLGSLYTTWSQVNPPASELPRAPGSRPAPARAPAATAAAGVAPEALVPTPAEPEPDRPLWPREVDGHVFGRIEGTLTDGTEARDVAPGTPFRIDLARPSGRGLVESATVDLDRDGKWDERWSFAGGAVSREVSPGDDGRYTETWRWADSDWVKVEPAAGAEPPAGG